VVFTVMAGLFAPLLIASGDAHAARLETELRLTAFSPITVEDGKTVHASGTFTTNKTLDDVVVRLEVGSTRFVSRSSIAEAAATPPYTAPVLGAEDDLKKVRRGETTTFRISFPASDLPLDAAGVYPMRLVATDSSGEVSSVSTFLPWAPDGALAPSRLLMFWPVIGDADQVTGGADGSVNAADSLTQSVSGTGRLATIVDAGERAPATWVVDPSVLNHADQLDEPAADAWVDAASSAIQQRRTVVLPYGDPDVAAVAAADRPGFLVQGQAKSTRVMNRLVGTTGPAVRSGLAWPADGAGDEQTIDTAGRAGDSFVLLDEENAPVVTPLTFTPSGRITWPDPELDVLLADESASALMASPASSPGDVLLARQRFLAETLLHSGELPDDPRLLVIAPPRRWDPSPLWADSLVDAVRHANWLDPVSLNKAVQPSPPPFEREAPTIPAEVASHQLPTDMVYAAQTALTDNRRFAAILTQPGRVTPAIEDDLFTSLSTAWRGDPEAAEASQDKTIANLQTMRNRVRIVSQGGTLANDRGAFPMTLRNELDQSVVVQLHVTSTDPLRLRVDGPTNNIRIGPEQSYSTTVNLDAVTSGRLSFDAQLRTPKGADYSDPVTVVVDVRGFGRITLVIFGAAVGLLVIAAGLRVFRRIRNARRGAS
jgi:hypothetical protein